MIQGVYLDLDGAWDSDIQNLRRLDLREWGPRLRYFARYPELRAFYHCVEGQLAPFVLHGSGDFHYLTAVLIQRASRPVTLVSFDNHPDWDVCPPFWSCGGWINRALENGGVERASVWGCGNFELAFPSRLFANLSALRTNRLEVHAWSERQTLHTQRRFLCMTRGDWQERFARFVGQLAGKDVYVTVDLDCLRAQEAVTNWENGLFTAADLSWALNLLHQHARVVGGDVCGAYSLPVYARWAQRIAGYWDHPRRVAASESQARAINRASLDIIWPALTESYILDS